MRLILLAVVAAAVAVERLAGAELEERQLVRLAGAFLGHLAAMLAAPGGLLLLASEPLALHLPGDAPCLDAVIAVGKRLGDGAGDVHQRHQLVRGN